MFKVRAFTAIALVLLVTVATANVESHETARDLQRNPNCVWCVWIPHPVKITLPDCVSCAKSQSAARSLSCAPGSEAAKRCDSYDAKTRATVEACQYCASNKVQVKTEDSARSLQNPNCVWCVWIPHPVKTTLPDCLGCAKTETAVQTNARALQQNPNCVWCIWVPQPVMQTLPQCGGCKNPYGTESVARSLQRNPNCVWCVWIPHPVKVTMPDCLGCAKESSASSLESKSLVRSLGGNPNCVWCVWIPHPVKVTMPDCLGCAKESARALSCAADSTAAESCKRMSAKDRAQVEACQDCPGKTQRSLQNQNCVWCIWIPQPVKVTLPQCATCAKETALEAVASEQSGLALNSSSMMLVVAALVLVMAVSIAVRSWVFHKGAAYENIQDDYVVSA